jgi:hypothetical protein
MKKVISYTIFGDSPRYWRMVPFTLLANSIYYPDWKTRIYVHRDAWETPGAKFLEETVKAAPESAECVKVERRFAPGQMKPMIFRMMALWDLEVDLFMTRDLDASPSTREAKAVRFWERSGCLFGGIRSYLLHSIPLMGGLSAFHAAKVRTLIHDSFEKFLILGDEYAGVQNGKEWEWNTDQWFMSHYFRGLLYGCLDFPMGSANPMQDFTGRLVRPDEYAGEVLNVPKEASDLIDPLVPSPGLLLAVDKQKLHDVLSTGAGLSGVIGKLIADTESGREFRL